MNMEDHEIELRLLHGEDDEMRDLQRVLEESPDYFERVTGLPPGSAEAQSTFTVLPEGKIFEDKFVFGIYLNEVMIGCADILRAYPNDETATIGLLLISEKYQSRGLGSLSYYRIEECIQNWEGCEKIGIGIILTNNKVIPFWEKMGYYDTGRKRPYEYCNVKSEVLIFEKSL